MASDAMVEAVGRALSLMEMTLANPPKLGPQLTHIWATVLEARGLTPQDVSRATNHVIATERFFPQPAVFIECINPKVGDDLRAEGAWQRVRDCLTRYGAQASLTAADLNNDPAALWALERVGWERIGTEMTEENRAIFRAEYVRVYRLAVSERAALHYLPGRLERENGGGSRELTPALVGRPDWRTMPGDRAALDDAPLTPVPEPLKALLAGIGIE